MPFVKGQIANPKGRGTLVSEMVKRKVIYKAWEKKDKRMSDNDATQIVLKDMTLKVGSDPENPLIVQIAESVAKKNDPHPNSKPDNQ